MMNFNWSTALFAHGRTDLAGISMKDLNKISQVPVSPHLHWENSLLLFPDQEIDVKARSHSPGI